MGFFDLGNQHITIEKKQTVIKITNEGRQALASGKIKGLAFDILSTMSDMYPHTVASLAEALHKGENTIKFEGNALLDLKFIQKMN
jgi:hypothetical protein